MGSQENIGLILHNETSLYDNVSCSMERPIGLIVFILGL